MPKKCEAVWISLIGSRAKGLNGKNSDYDVRVIALYPQRAYMLQQQDPTSKIKTSVDGVEVEGTVVDVQLALSYSVDSNPFMYDLFYGEVLLSTPVSDGIKAFFLEAFDQATIRKSITGQVTGYMKRKACGFGDTKLVRAGNTTTLKIATDAAYLAVKIKFINQNANVVPPFNIHQLIESAFEEVELQSKNMIFELVK